MHQLPRTTLPGNERGATLIVALILLILISLIGATSLRSASVAEKMSAANHLKNITFQASESAAAVALSNQALIGNAIVSGVPQTTVIDVSSTDVSTQVVFTSVGSSPLLNASIGENGFSGQRIMVTATAQLTSDARSTSETVHGVVQKVPGG